MTNLLLSLKLSETDKRLLIAVFLLLILVFLIFGLLYDSIKAIMDKQGKRVDSMMNLIVGSGLIVSRKQFKKIAHHKSDVYFYKVTRVYVIILAIAGLLHLTYF